MITDLTNDHQKTKILRCLKMPQRVKVSLSINHEIKYYPHYILSFPICYKTVLSPQDPRIQKIFIV